MMTQSLSNKKRREKFRELRINPLLMRKKPNRKPLKHNRKL